MANPQARQFLEQAVQSIQSGQFAQALQLVDQSIALEPDNSEAHVVRAISLSQTSQPDAAIDAFNRAIDFDPGNVKAFFNLAVHFSALGRKADALAAAQDSLKIDPSHSAANDLVNKLRAEGISAATATWQPPKRPATATVIDASGEVASSAGTAPVGMPSSMPPASSRDPGFAAPYQEQMSSMSGPTTNPYMRPRPGFATQSEHSLDMVRNMGNTWTVVGTVITVILLLASIGYVVGALPLFQEAFADPEGFRAKMAANPEQYTAPLATISQLIIMVMWFAMLVWMILDMVDRRRGWFWLIPMVLCCCGLLSWATPAIYLGAGRKA